MILEELAGGGNPRERAAVGSDVVVAIVVGGLAPAVDRLGGMEAAVVVNVNCVMMVGLGVEWGGRRRIG
jgi:hypothetical protein